MEYDFPPLSSECDWQVQIHIQVSRTIRIPFQDCFFTPPGISCFLFFTCVQHMCGFSSTRVFVCVFEAPACAMLMTHLHYKRVELFLCLWACGLLQLQPNQADVWNKRERNLHELLNFLQLSFLVLAGCVKSDLLLWCFLMLLHIFV